MPKQFFQIIKKDKKSQARAGVINTLHGPLKTPVLMTVGTKANVKGITPAQLKEIGVGVVLCNTYHLFLNPGEDTVKKMGGLHGFMNWDGPMFTDSGGFQVFSMGHGTMAEEVKGKANRHKKKSVLKIAEEGVTFKSYIDGALKVFTPEKSMQIQHKLGADMIVAFDECTPFHVEKKYTENSMELTHRWLDRCVKYHKKSKSKQALFAVIQGGIYKDLRKRAVDYCASVDTPGLCIGGSLGQTEKDMHSVVRMVAKMLPKEKPVHLLGIGGIRDIINGVEHGIDTFDCVTPTRNARHGLLYSSEGKDFKININNSKFRKDKKPIDKKCGCYVCQNFSRSYLNFLLRAKEILGLQLCSYHNIYFMNNFMKELRQAILDDKFVQFKKKYVK